MGAGAGWGRVLLPPHESAGCVEIHVLGGARLRRRSSPPCGPRARGCRLVLVGQVYARVHEWWSGRVRWQAPCNGIDLLAHKASQYRVPGLVPRTVRRRLLCILPTVWQMLDLRSPTLPTMAWQGRRGSAKVPSRPVRVAHERLGIGTSGASVLSGAVLVSGSQCVHSVPQRMSVIIDKRRSWHVLRGSALGACRGARAMTSLRDVTWLILPVVICLSQRLSHACVSMN